MGFNFTAWVVPMASRRRTLLTGAAVICILAGLYFYHSHSRVDRIMARMEEVGPASDWCSPSLWLTDQKREMGLDPNELVPGEFDLITGDNADECNATKVFMEEILWPDMVTRTYRCKANGRDFELNYAVDLDPKSYPSFTGCSYAISIDDPFNDQTRYTSRLQQKSSLPLMPKSGPRERPSY